MHWTFEKFEAPEFIRIVGGGLFSSDGFVEMFDELFSLEYWHFGIPLFFDHRNLDLSGITPSQLLAASNDFLARNNSLAYTKIAVMFDDSVRELAERFGQVTRPYSTAFIHLYRDEKEALDWLVPQHARVAL